MSSKQDKNFEKKMAEIVAQGEKTDDLEPVTKKARIAKEPTIRFPNETWEEIVMWCNRLELGQHVSLVNDRLFCIAYPFMHEEKEHPLPWLNLCDDESNELWVLICRHYENDEELPKSEIPSVKVKELLQFFEGKVQGLDIGRWSTFSELQEQCVIPMKDLFFVQLGLGVVHIGNEELEIRKKWLYQSREDGSPKVLRILSLIDREFVEMIKKEFLSSNKQTSFLITIREEDDEDLSCNLDNSATEERLTIQLELNGNDWLIARQVQDCPTSAQEMFNNARASIVGLPTIIV